MKTKKTKKKLTKGNQNPSILEIELVVISDGSEVIVTSKDRIPYLNNDWPGRDWNYYNAAVHTGPFSFRSGVNLDEFTKAVPFDLP